MNISSVLRRQAAAASAKAKSTKKGRLRPAKPKHSVSASSGDPASGSKPTYYDPSNKSLDFSKPNRTLFSEIVGESNRRIQLRITGPADRWVSSLGRSNVAKWKKEVEAAVKTTRVSFRKSLTALQVGDLVLLTEHSTLLHLVVAAPASLASNVYTFISHEGEVIYGTKFQIVLRIPRVLTPQQVSALRFVYTERKYDGIAPIGMPDTLSARRRKDPHSEFGQPGIKRSGDSHSEESPNSSVLEEEVSAVVPVTSPDDLIVAHAASQLLADTGVKTHIVPASARAVYADVFSQMAIVAYRKVTAFSNKLEYFHRVLQYDENNCLIHSPRTLPLFELFTIVSGFGKTLEVINSVRGSPDEYKTVNSIVRGIRHRASHSFGMALPHDTAIDFATSSHSISSYIAFLLALSRSGRKWKINVQQSTKTPISVDILPVMKSTSLEDALDYLKKDGVESFSSYVVNQIVGKIPNDIEKPVHYEEVVQVLKDFVIGNISHDHTMESLSASVVRRVDQKLKDLDFDESSSIPLSYDYSRGRAYQILMSLEPTGDRNPIHWDASLGLPNMGTSRDSDVFFEYYNYLDKSFTKNKDLWSRYLSGSDEDKQMANNNSSLCSPVLQSSIEADFYCDDPMKAVREDFGPTPVYCIDSATAHEIDDGISIQTTGADYVITVHVANPTSYIRPDSSLSQVAYRKGATVYLPEGPTMMLPDLVSKLCGLNGDKTCRTFAIQFSLKKNKVKQYIKAVRGGSCDKPSNRLAEELLNSIQKTVQIKFFTVSNFPKNFTYENVNKILRDPINIEKFNSKQLAEGTHEWNLFHLYHISSILRHVRLGIGEGFEFDSEKPKVSVEYSASGSLEGGQMFKHVENGWQIALPKDHKSDSPVITITKEVNQNKESPSQQLVSNFMIAANFAGSYYAKKHDLPIIHRSQKLDITDSVRRAVNKLNRDSYYNDMEFTVEQSSQVLSIMTSANFSTLRGKHETLGLTIYSNLTSPLRRYVDMINHWIFQRFIHERYLTRGTTKTRKEKRREIGETRKWSKENPEISTPQEETESGSKEKENALCYTDIEPSKPGEGMGVQSDADGKNHEASEQEETAQEQSRAQAIDGTWSASDLDCIASNLQGCEFMNKRAQKFSDKFWMLRFLQQYFELQRRGAIERPIEFSFLLRGDAKYGDMRAEAFGFSGVRTTIVQNTYVVQKFANQEWEVGSVIRNPQFRVLKLDPIEDDFTVEIFG